MSDVLWERTFELSFPIERVWTAYFEMGGTGTVPPVGFTAVLPDAAKTRVEVTDVVEHERFVYEQTTSKEHATMTVVFEATDTGTRIVITRAGFGDMDDFDVLNESRPLGYWESMRDLAVYLETGVAERRHLRERSATGVVLKDTEAGLVVRRVKAGTTGAQAGLVPGDLLVSVNGAAVYERRDMWFLARLLDEGAEVEFGFIRGGEAMTGRGRMCSSDDAVLGELGLGPRERVPDRSNEPR
jgi:membrane-associated protease RseP (regulator of RpoE activity)